MSEVPSGSSVSPRETQDRPLDKGRESRRQAVQDKPSPGRNLKVAIPVALLLGGVVAASLLFYPPSFVALAIIAVGLAVYELDQAFAHGDSRVSVVPVVVGGTGILVSAYRLGLESMLAALVMTAAACVLWRLLDGDGGPSALRDISSSVFAVAYLPFLASFAILILAELGAQAVIVFIVLAVASDTGGFVIGVLLGKHKMAPNISPKKTWEGFAGSLIFSLAAALVSVYLLGVSLWWALLLGVAATFTAIVGDLAESLLKRDLGVKDMGTLLPGHGGILDRLDSLLISAPVCYLILRTALLT
ncbi:MAG: phosphatidate cytidylyltransferase [Actinomycetaceae bacterium]|nr:phosphatidate cytidylyltransferase [Actinomycetaceae bacterium]